MNGLMKSEARLRNALYRTRRSDRCVTHAICDNDKTQAGQLSEFILTGIDAHVALGAANDPQDIFRSALSGHHLPSDS